MTGKDWLILGFTVLGALCLICLFLSPVLMETWAINIIKNREIHNMDKLVTGKIERSLDCYGYSATKLSNWDMDKMHGVVLNDVGQRIDLKYLRTDVTYALYKVGVLGGLSFYYLECEGN